MPVVGQKLLLIEVMAYEYYYVQDVVSRLDLMQDTNLTVYGPVNGSSS
jgi:hypothetical protein